MAVRVSKVPNPWDPYNNGDIWELTEQEYQALPTYRTPTDDNGFPLGKQLYTWYIGKKYYVRFVEPGEIIDIATGLTVSKFSPK